MATYLLDFTASPLKPEAGGQYHRVHVGHGAHDNVQTAAADIILKYGLVGETADAVPEAKVVCYQENAAPFDIFVQVEPASAAPDYEDPVKPTTAEVLAAFPKATDIDVRGQPEPKRTFLLHQTRFVLTQWADGSWLVESLDKTGDLEYRRPCGKAWVDAVRDLATYVLANQREEIDSLTAEAAALEAAIGGAQ